MKLCTILIKTLFLRSNSKFKKYSAKKLLILKCVTLLSTEQYMYILNKKLFFQILNLKFNSCVNFNGTAKEYSKHYRFAS